MRILVYHIGSLGDTLISVPCLWAARENFPGAHITMLANEPSRAGLVQAWDVLNGSGLVDDYVAYPAGISLAAIRLFRRLREHRFDMLLYLRRVCANRWQLRRDSLFFRLAGIHRTVGMQGIVIGPLQQPSPPMWNVSHKADQLLARLRASGLRVPAEGDGCFDLKIGTCEWDAVTRWLATLPDDGGRKWCAIGPGSNMPCKLWPAERYEAVLKHLIAEYDLWPVVFGGPEDRVVGERMISVLGKGYVAAGALGIRASMAGMQRCLFFLGNDTGTMHMAAASGLRCIVPFSSRDSPGRWYPYGHGHKVFRTPVSCEGCMLQECVERRMECILSISVQEVLDAARDILRDAVSIAKH